MRPAFALATKMITCDSLLGWWIRVLYGSLREDEATGRRYFAPDLEREQNFPQAKKELEAVFAKLGDKLRWHWKPENEASASTNRNAWGALGSVHERKKGVNMGVVERDVVRQILELNV